jgi:DNA (cytosine-5)-methyltransferase 1
MQLSLPDPDAPRSLDLFCGGGGCAVGYARAGFAVTGADLHPQPHYPLPDVIQADSTILLADEDFLRGFVLITGSPPCKLWTPLHKRVCDGGPTCTHLDLLTPTLVRLDQLGLPYIVENVPGAPTGGRATVTLCGSMFDLGVDGARLKRHRQFVSNLPLSAPRPCTCRDGRPVVGVYGDGGASVRTMPGGGGRKVARAKAATALGVDWTTHQPALAQMIPPAYTEHLGRQALAALGCDTPTPPASSPC